MPNLNSHDVLFLNSKEFSGFSERLMYEYDFEIREYELPPFVSFTSRKLLLHTNKGTYFLKEKPLYCSDADSLNRMAAFQKYMNTQMTSIPTFLPTASGETYLAWNQRFFFLTEYKPGRHFNGSDADVHSILVALKEFNVAALGYNGSFEYPAIREADSRNFESYDHIIPIGLLEAEVREDDDYVLLTRISTLVQRLKDNYHSNNDVDYGICHGDFSLFNVLLDGQGVVTITDFDNAKMLPRVQDLAEFLVSATLVNYMAPLTNLKLPVLLTPTLKPFNIIINAYTSLFQLTENEQKLLPILVEIVWADMLLLAVLKGDYTLQNIEPAITKLEKKCLRDQVQAALCLDIGM